jgi:TRAP-type C4-dicarboxylate transport system substrate-binding protein
MKRLQKVIAVLVLAGLLATQGGSERAYAESGDFAPNAQIVLKVATVAPRIPEIARRSKQFNEQLAAETNGRVQFRTYWGGVAGDDTTIMRKLRTGQIDAAPLGVEVVSNYVRQASVLVAPQTFYNYKQVDAVRKELGPEFGEEAYKNGVKILSWWDAGRVRIFSKQPIRTFADLQKGRPWLYPSSTLLKEFYKMTDVTGIPLDISEVYGGLQTGMIDTVWISSVLSSVLRWASHTNYVSPPVNVIQGAFVVRREAWEALNDNERKVIERLSAKQLVDTQKELRDGDETTYVKLVKRGMVPVELAPVDKWRAMGAQLRNKMIGRIYTKEMLNRVESITKKYGEDRT